jgi:hypothetical protein
VLADAVHGEVRACGQPVEVVDHVAVQRDGTGHAQRRQRGPVEHGQPREVRRGQAGDAALLGAREQVLQLPPDALALAAELIALEPQHQTSSRRLISK